MNWFYSKDGQQVGPVAFTEIERLYSEGQLNDDSLIWQQGTANWIKLSAARAAAGEPVPPVAPAPAIPVVQSAPAAAATVPVPKGKTNGFAITSLVLGILGLICCSALVVNIGAIVFGHLALKQLAKDPALEGLGLAKAGLILGYIGLALGVVVWILQLIFGVMGYAVPHNATY